MFSGVVFLTYANDAKKEILGVSRSSLDKAGAVSEEVVTQMLQGALKKSGAELAIAVSGIAGPGGGTADKPVGTVWVGVMLKSGSRILKKVSVQREQTENSF